MLNLIKNYPALENDFISGAPERKIRPNKNKKTTSKRFFLFKLKFTKFSF